MAWSYDDEARWHQNQADNARSEAERAAQARAAEQARIDADAERRREQAEADRRYREQLEEDARRRQKAAEEAYRRNQERMDEAARARDAYARQSGQAASNDPDSSSYGSFNPYDYYIPTYDSNNPGRYVAEVLGSQMASGRADFSGCFGALVKWFARLYAFVGIVTLLSGGAVGGLLEWILLIAAVYFGFLKDWY